MVKKKFKITGVVGVAVNSQGEVLMTKRHQPQTPDVHGKWQIPGGGIEFGESPEETVKRELKEEIGCEVKIVKLIPYLGSVVYRRPKMDSHIVLIGYVVKIVKGQPKPSHYEIAEVKWMKPGEIDFSKCLKLTKEFLVAGGLLKS